MDIFLLVTDKFVIVDWLFVTRLLMCIMQIIFFDTETTDLDPGRRLVQLAYKNPASGKVVNEYFKPPMAISFGAMSIHHITNEMVADKPVFQETEHYKNAINDFSDAVAVAHNAPFDIEVLKNEGITVGRYIDTCQVARHLIESEQYKLQYLRYFLRLQAEGVAHDALGDITVLEALFYRLREIAQEKFALADEAAVLEKMIALSQAPVMIRNFGFGKYRGKTFEEVSAIDRGYLEWLLGSETQKSPAEQNQELLLTLKHYIK